MTLDFSALKALLLDMDGVIYRGMHPLPGAQELDATLHTLDMRCLCLTNNSSKTPAEFVEKLAMLGITMHPEQILSSSTATGELLRERYPQGTKIFAIGMHGLQQALFADGYFMPAEVDAELVVVGIDFEVTYAKLRTATLAIRNGATFYATNADRTFPSPEGLVPGAGAIVAAIQAATDQQPRVIGKPEPAIFEAALHMLDLEPHQVAMVGDRLDTDIAGAQQAGIPTIWLASGVHTRADVERWQPQPDLLLNDLSDVLARLREARQ